MYWGPLQKKWHANLDGHVNPDAATRNLVDEIKSEKWEGRLPSHPKILPLGRHQPIDFLSSQIAPATYHQFTQLQVTDLDAD